MNAAFLYPFIFVAGALQSLGNSMNAQLRGRLVNPWLAATVSFLPVVFVFATIFFILPTPLPTLATLGSLPWYAPLGGVAGAVAVFGGHRLRPPDRRPDAAARQGRRTGDGHHDRVCGADGDCKVRSATTSQTKDTDRDHKPAVHAAAASSSAEMAAVTALTEGGRAQWGARRSFGARLARGPAQPHNRCSASPWLSLVLAVSGRTSLRLLLVEDNRDLARWLAEILRVGRYVVDVVHDGAEAEACLRGTDYGLVILDLALPVMDGIEVLRRLRARRGTIPVIVLTADASLKSRVSGLDAGADDYLTKPFEVSELEARIRAQLRRSSGQPANVVRCGDLALDTLTRSFSLRGATLALTPREAAVLEQLLRRQGRTLSKAALAETVFGFDDDADPSAIEVYVHRLRKKLEGGKVSIATLRGLGYVLRHEEG